MRDAVQRLRPGNAAVSGKDKTQRQLRGVADADARRRHHAPGARSVVAHLQGRFGIQQIQPIVRAPRNSQRLAKPAGSARQFFRGALSRAANRVPRFRAICSSPATGSRARISTPPPWPARSHETFMQKYIP